MAWLQENYIIAVVGLVVAVVLLWWLFGRSKPKDIAPTIVEPAKPAKPLEPVKPTIVAAEPARFKPLEPKAQPVAPPHRRPAPEPVAKAPSAEPAPRPSQSRARRSRAAAPKTAAKPKAAAKPAAKKVGGERASGETRRKARQRPQKAAPNPAPKPAAKAATKAAPKAAAKKRPNRHPLRFRKNRPSRRLPLRNPPRKASKTGPDNLQLLKGVGPKLAVLLGGLGVNSFRQIADWTDADIARIDPQLGTFQGRIARDNIVDQAGYLASGDKAGFEAKYGALGGEL
jgi:predicted flap endonuclease-1-like 5' DNA nuclease